MQLILETDNPSLSLKENMSALEQDTLHEKPLTNGDVKLTEEVKSKTSGKDVEDKENNVQNGIKHINNQDNDAITSANISEKENSETDTKQRSLATVNVEMNIENNLNKELDEEHKEENKESQVDIVHENQLKTELATANTTTVEDEKSEPMDVDANSEINDSDLNASLNAMAPGIVEDLDEVVSQDNLDEIKLETEKTNDVDQIQTKQTPVPIVADLELVVENKSVPENIGNSVEFIGSNDSIEVDLVVENKSVPENIGNPVEFIGSNDSIEVDQVSSNTNNSINCIDPTETKIETTEAKKVMTTAETNIETTEVDKNSNSEKTACASETIQEESVSEEIKDISEKGSASKNEIVEIFNAEVQHDSNKLNDNDKQGVDVSESSKVVINENIESNIIKEKSPDANDVIDIDSQDQVEVMNIDEATDATAVKVVDDSAVICDAQVNSGDINVDAKDNVEEIVNSYSQNNTVTNVDDMNIDSQNNAETNLNKEDNVTEIADGEDKVNLADITDVKVQDKIADMTAMEIQENSTDITDIEVKNNDEGITDIDGHGDSAGIPGIDCKDASTGNPDIDIRDESIDITEADVQEDTLNKPTPSENDEVVDLDGIEDSNSDSTSNISQQQTNINQDKPSTPLIKLSNTLDILSDDDEEPSKPEEPSSKEPDTADKQCINLDDDDDIMLIDEVPATPVDKKVSDSEKVEKEEEKIEPVENIVGLEKETINDKETDDATPTITETEPNEETKVEEVAASPKPESKPDETTETVDKPQPLIPEDFFKGYRKNLADMTRDDLEEFCLIKIVESIIDRSSLNEIRAKLKTMAANIEEHKKKAMLLSKQNRDLQVVLKSIQEEQKKHTDQPIVPLKITRSVGMQVLMNDKTRKRHMPIPTPQHGQTNNLTQQLNNLISSNTSKSTRSQARIQKAANSQPIPVPRLVPAVNNTQNKNVAAPSPSKVVALQNNLKVPPLASKAPEKRTYGRMQSPGTPQSVTVDLTDDEPPSKLPTKGSPMQPVRLLYPQNIVTRPQFAAPSGNSPRKVYIPISGPVNIHQNTAIRSLLKPVPSPSSKVKATAMPIVRVPQPALGVRRVANNNRHPAPLPECSKQYQPPNWKALPPAPDLRLSKVENGIVISWKIEGYQEDSYEEIASYQLFAYQEPPGPPMSSLWKKIGDVKALPLPMACTLTQFMAGFKYYFAVRAVDVRSRFGPFSLPGSILLLNKM